MIDIQIENRIKCAILISYLLAYILWFMFFTEINLLESISIEDLINGFMLMESLVYGIIVFGLPMFLELGLLFFIKKIIKEEKLILVAYGVGSVITWHFILNYGLELFLLKLAIFCLVYLIFVIWGSNKKFDSKEILDSDCYE